MSPVPIYQYIADHLQTAVCLYDENQQLIADYPEGNTRQFPQLNTALVQSLCQNSAYDYPVFTFINKDICFASFYQPENYNERTVIIGPFRLSFIENIHHALHNLTVESPVQYDSYTVPVIYPPHILHLVLLLFNCCHMTSLSDNDCWQKNFNTLFLADITSKKTMTALFSNRENQRTHNPYAQELRLLQSIERGDIELLHQVWTENVTQSLGTTAVDPVRNGKNMAIYTITACGRAAIRAGISAEYIFTLTDSYAQQVEALKNLLLLQTLVENAQLHFTQLVAELNTKKNISHKELPLIRHCKDYIFNHLHDPLTVTQIAAQLKVHPNYLNSLFRRQEGTSLYQYILGEKIKLVKNLLTYSDYSYMEIAHYLGFLSQSHLGTRFKAMTGMTLKQYRDIHHKDLFFDE